MVDPQISDQSLLNAVAENHRVWFRRNADACANGAVDVSGSELFLGPEAMIFPGSELDVDLFMAEVRARDCRSVGCWSLTADPRLGVGLLARGFGWGWRPHWMAIDLDDNPSEPVPTRFVVRAAAPPYARTLPYAPSGPEPSDSIRLGVRLKEKVIGHVVVNPWNGVAGIYSMGVAPRVRRRGIGAALTRAACRRAIEHGCRHAVLNATDEGTLLYERVGFRSLGWGQTWWYCRGPEPTRRQIALAEAVGYGDLGALEALRPSQPELTDPLPSGETPLTLSLLADQPAMADHILRRCPKLGDQRFAPHGATLLHLAVEHERPAFVTLALAHGVDPEARDETFNATAHGWAQHFGHAGIAEILSPS